MRCSMSFILMKNGSTLLNRSYYRSFLVDKVLPAIVAKWPPGNTTVKLQHDNARAHVTATDANLCAAFASCKCVGWSFSLAPQPSNSPDLNILDLGFFAAIQSIQHRKAARNIDDLVANVCHAFDEYPSARLERTFLTLQVCMVETMRLFGDNTYRVPHHLKEKMARKGSLPGNMSCPMDVYSSAKAQLEAADSVAMELAFVIEERETTDMMALFCRLE
ncbi:Aste57867_14537 [Aphanomyces stellatus]|uniref:Aste57867_14537 protein n=1 Tax=Aphanomyces stellatus TaxID=120398 RepID=A0A485L1Q8_9STRA|nr:hypothetical protein As57867_014483 [Aphanomyces stellatus]VFT91359.1 Aste57867_14537 [Aphanomyces stellatus]